MPSVFETLVEVVREQLDDPTIAWGVFRVDVAKKDSPRRVVWVPGEFTCSGVFYSGPVTNQDGGDPGDALLVDKLSVEAHIYGRTFEDACEIRRCVLNAANDCLGISSIPRHGVYASETAADSGYAWGGMSKIIQVFEWQLNVARNPVQRINVREIDQTSELHGDAGVTSELLIITTP